MSRVLRLRVGDIVSVFDGSGREFGVRLEALDDSAVGMIFETTTPTTEASVRLTLVQSLPKGEKIDLILQKCTEIGVAEFLIAESERSVPSVPAERLAPRLERWRAIVREAAEQSGRVRVPGVDGILPFREAVERVRGAGTALIAWEREVGSALLSGLKLPAGVERVAFFVGPEGGFTEDEVSFAREAGIAPVSLGPRTLRTETAAIVGCSLIIYRPANGEIRNPKHEIRNKFE